MIAPKTMKLVRRIAGTAALLAVTLVLVVIYLRSEGKGVATPALAATGRSGGGGGGPQGSSGGSSGAGGAGGSGSSSSGSESTGEPGGSSGEPGGSSGEPGGSSGEPGGSSGEAGESSSESNGSGSAGKSSHGGGSGSSKAPQKAGGRSGTVTGPVVQTPYGPVQVVVQDQGGKLVEAKAIQLPTEHSYSLYISERVGPMLRAEALKAQSAQINIVTGATFTSEGFASSLQRALSQLG
ncbi:MAG: FMN-binding protein [Solirubrobacteraceae bacterium]